LGRENKAVYEDEWGVVDRTEDGGKTWNHNQISSSPVDKDGAFIDASFVDSREGWAVGSSVIRHTTDGGVTWEIQYKKKYDPTNLYGFETVQFLDSHTGWVVGSSDGDTGYFTGILRTTDDGKSWRESRAQHPLYRIHFLNSSVGIGVGAATPENYPGNPGRAPDRDGIIMDTADAGDTWKEVFRASDSQ